MSLRLAFTVGIIGGVYGIGGGSIIAPFCITFFNLPVYTIAGAVLLGTFTSSAAGVAFYSFIPLNGEVAAPDWMLGILFGTTNYLRVKPLALFVGIFTFTFFNGF